MRRCATKRIPAAHAGIVAVKTKRETITAPMRLASVRSMA
jgi:hypothetical protein